MANPLMDAALAALSPYVGPTAADTCMRATALKAGKIADELCAEDLPAMEDSIRRLLAAVAPAGAIDAIVAQVREGGRL